MLGLRYLACLTFLKLINGAALYDYIVVGGGTSGLAVANRLSQDPSNQVAVIERGDSVLNNSREADPDVYLSGGTPSITSFYPTTPQRNANNRTLGYIVGRALGGTSTINGMTYLRAQDVQIDAWEALGNPGWDWESVLPYYKRSEQLDIPTTGETFDPRFNGFLGPLTVGWQSAIMRGNATAIMNDTSTNLRLPYNYDANDGQMQGFVVWPFTVNPRTGNREDAARAYYYPIAERPNLHVYLNSNATRITWAQDSKDTDNLKATGVVFTTVSGAEKTISAEKEIVLSLGTFKTPVMLENSGIGNPTILDRYSIPVRVNLPGVGENLVDQPNTPLGATLNTNQTFLGFPPYAVYPTAADIFGTNVSEVARAIRAAIPQYAAINSEASGNATTRDEQERLLQVATDAIFNHPTTTPIGELFLNADASSGRISIPAWISTPFSRGSVHISSSDPLANPTINPNFFFSPADTIMQVSLARFARQYFTTEPLSNYIDVETTPGLSTIPMDATDEQWMSWLQTAVSATQHGVGTSSMKPRELGGVVDSELRVYGTQNLRVVDASIWPTQLSGHLTSSCYMVAERAADFILNQRNV